LEILLVVAAIGILAGIVILAINPGKQLGDTRNAQRRIDVNTILNAVYQYGLDNNGNLSTLNLPTATACVNALNEICKLNATCTNFVDLGALVGPTEKYLVSIPIDPSGGTANGTRYGISQSATGGRVTVCAPSAEQNATISVTR